MHPEKALALIDVTDGGIEIFLSKTQLLNANSPIFVISGGIANLTMRWQFSKSFELISILF